MQHLTIDFRAMETIVTNLRVAGDAVRDATAAGLSEAIADAIEEVASAFEEFQNCIDDGVDQFNANNDSDAD